jgi:hypothetical protein
MRLIKSIFPFSLLLVSSVSMIHSTVTLADGGKPLADPWILADGGRPVPDPWTLVADGGRPVPDPWALVADGGRPVPDPWKGIVS